jgi:hypothetical protein
MNLIQGCKEKMEVISDVYAQVKSFRQKQLFFEKHLVKKCSVNFPCEKLELESESPFPAKFSTGKHF